MNMLQDRQRRFGVAFPRPLMQQFGDFHLPIRAAFHFGHLSQLVELAQLPIFRRTHSSSQRQRITFQPAPGCVIDRI